MHAIRVLLGFLFAFVLAQLVEAQVSSWDNLLHIRPGTKVEVIERSLRKTSGRFARFSDADLTVKVANNDVSIPRTQVFRVTIIGKNRKRNTLLGFGIGAAFGVAWGAGLHAAGADLNGGQATAFAAGVAGIGAGIGAIIPASKTVIRRNAQNVQRKEEQSPQQ
jgi:hypothetical protein